MSKPVKVFNKGVRPVVFKRDRTGTDAIHPGKFLTFDEDKAKGIIKDFEDACSEKEYKAFLEKREKEREEARKKAEAEAKKESAKKADSEAK